MDRPKRKKRQKKIFRRKDSKLEQFVVTFDSDGEQYKSGDWVMGHARAEVSGAPMKHIQGITLHYEGDAMTDWKEEEFNPHELSGPDDNYERTRGVNYYARETYFRENIFLLGEDNHNKENDHQTMSLNIGEHVLPFKFQIPANALPPSFECDSGYIRYKVYATIVKKYDKDVTTQERLFTIIGAGANVKANTEQGKILASPSEVETYIGLGCWCCMGVPTKASFQVNKIGFVPGETVLVSGAVRNFSRTKPTVKLTLLQKIAVRAKRDGDEAGWEHLKNILEVLAEHTVESSDEHAEVSFEQIPLLIPPFSPPSRLRRYGCGIMDILYFIRLDTDVMRLDSIFQEIVVGTSLSSEKIPLDDIFVAPTID